MLQHLVSTSLRPREARRRVMLPARLRSASGWSDACILNISSGGLLVFSKGTAEPGSTVEIRRGGAMVVARVAWRHNQRIGLESEAPIVVSEIINVEMADAALPGAFGVGVERRRTARPRSDSRTRARTMEFLAAVLFGTAMAVLAAASVEQALARPLAAVGTMLGRP